VVEGSGGDICPRLREHLTSISSETRKEMKGVIDLSDLVAVSSVTFQRYNQLRY